MIRTFFFKWNRAAWVKRNAPKLEGKFNLKSIEADAQLDESDRLFIPLHSINMPPPLSKTIYFNDEPNVKYRIIDDVFCVLKREYDIDFVYYYVLLE